MARKVEIKDLRGIVRRRKWFFLVPFSIVIVVAAIASIYLAPVYKSEATIVIENQEIPEDYVKSTITTYVDERLHLIQRRLMSYAKLKEIIDNYHPYNDLESVPEMMQKMRKNIKLQTINAAINNERTGRTNSATIAFTLSYEGSDPATVQKVTEVLANLYIEEDKRTRIKFAETTSLFFEKELAGLKKNVHSNEEKIRKFKVENINTLPGSTNVNLQAISRLEQDLDRINTRILTLRGKNIYLKSQITNVDPLKPILTEQGMQASNPNERLKQLRLKMIRMEATMSPKHPDIKALRSEITQLEKQVGYADVASDKIKQLMTLKAQWAEMKGTYGEKHPDYIQLSKQIALLSKEVDDNGSEKAMIQLAAEAPDNPAFMNMRAQIVATQIELNALYSDRLNIKNKIDLYQQKIEQLPIIEEEYSKLTLDYENAKHKYNEILNKLQTARISEEMDMSQRGERFSILEPAILPVHPYKPERIKILILGFIVGAGLGLCAAALGEGLDQSAKTADDVESLMNVPVLASVSLYNSPQKKGKGPMEKLKNCVSR